MFIYNDFVKPKRDPYNPKYSFLAFFLININVNEEILYDKYIHNFGCNIFSVKVTNSYSEFKNVL